MAHKVTTDDIKQFNELYYELQSYAEVARRTGWSASTVSKYIDKNYKPVVVENIKRFDLKTDLPHFSTSIFTKVENLGDLCVLIDEEYAEMVSLWEELSI